MKKFLSILICFLLLFSISSCSSKPEEKVSNGLSSEETLKMYFDSWNKKDEEKMKSFLSNELYQVDFKLNSLNSISLDKCKKVDKIQSSFNAYFEYVFYDATFTIDYKNGGVSGLSNGTYTWQYALIKPSSTSNWIIKSYEA